MKILTALFTFAAFVTPALAAETMIGNFHVSIEKDKFDEGMTVLAVVPQGDDGLILRCLQGQRNIAVYIDEGDGSQWKVGDTGTIKVKVDDKPVRTLNVGVVNNKVLQLQNSSGLIDEMMDAKEVDLRLTMNDVTGDYEFHPMMINNVIEQVNKGCNKS